jgi:hypothetical protein
VKGEHVSYVPREVLAAVDHHIPVVAVFGAFAAIATFTYLAECFRLARRDKAYPVALGAVGWFAVHDLIFAFQFDKWWNEYGHWWTELWWFALCGTATMECALVGLVIKYGHRELLPQVSKRVFAGLVIAATIGIGAIWWCVKLNLDDDLYLISFPITALWALPLGTGMLLRRQSTRGQSVLLPACVIVIVVSFQGAFWFLDPMFRSWPFMLITITAVCWGGAEIWLMGKFPSYNPDVDSAVWPAEVRLARETNPRKTVDGGMTQTNRADADGAMVPQFRDQT